MFNAETWLNIDFADDSLYTGKVKYKVTHSYVNTSDSGEYQTYNTKNKVGEVLEERTVIVCNWLAISEMMKMLDDTSCKKILSWLVEFM